MFIKICGLRTTETVAAALDAGADALGFVFADSARRIEPDQARALCRELPPAIVRVAVMRHPEPAYWQRVCDLFEPDWLQTDAGDFVHLNVPPGCTALPVHRDSAGSSPRQWPQRLLFESAVSGAGRQADWQRAATIARVSEVILAGGLNPANVGDAIRQVRPFGVDVSSGVESSPGVKDPDKITRFIEAVRRAEKFDDA